MILRNRYKMPLFQEIFRNLKRSISFFLLIGDIHSEAQWYQVMTFNGYNKVVMNPLEFLPNGRLIEKYDLQGLHILTTGLSWKPFLELNNCSKEGFGCEESGYLSDFMDFLGQRLNFTWDTYRDAQFDWGIQPVNGLYFVLE